MDNNMPFKIVFSLNCLAFLAEGHPCF